MTEDKDGVRAEAMLIVVKSTTEIAMTLHTDTTQAGGTLMREVMGIETKIGEDGVRTEMRDMKAVAEVEVMTVREDQTVDEIMIEIESEGVTIGNANPLEGTSKMIENELDVNSLQEIEIASWQIIVNEYVCLSMKFTKRIEGKYSCGALSWSR